jgi:GNAT superfamily N-acetyltransferase
VISSDQSRPTVHTLVADEMPRLAAALGDSPETVIAHYLLTTGACNAWCVDGMDGPTAAVVQAELMPAEPTAFGTSAEDILRIIPHIEGWTSILVPTVLARSLERPIAVAAGTLTINTLEDVYHVLDGPVATLDCHPDVRLLTPDDAELLGGLEALSSTDAGEMIIAAAIVEDEIVSVAHTFAWSPAHVDIGVTTHEDWRGLGYATSAAAIVSDEILKRGRTPVWSCGAHNEPSMRIAGRLGFRETSRKVYIIPLRKDS